MIILELQWLYWSCVGHIRVVMFILESRWLYWSEVVMVVLELEYLSFS